jgi:hypothetical protein
MSKKYYVVWRGRQTGIFESWEECEAQVKGFPDARYKSFPSRALAEAAFRQPPPEPDTSPTSQGRQQKYYVVWRGAGRTGIFESWRGRQTGRMRSAGKRVPRRALQILPFQSAGRGRLPSAAPRTRHLPHLAGQAALVAFAQPAPAPFDLRGRRLRCFPRPDGISRRLDRKRRGNLPRRAF